MGVPNARSMSRLAVYSGTAQEQVLVIGRMNLFWTANCLVVEHARQIEEGAYRQDKRPAADPRRFKSTYAHPTNDNMHVVMKPTTIRGAS